MKKKKWEWTATCGDYSATGSSDYPNDWNATIRAIEAKGWMWSMSHGHTNRLAMVGIVKDGHIFRDEMPLSKKEPPCVALMRAAVEAAKSIDKQTMDDNL